MTPSPEVSGRSLSPSPEVSGSSVGPSPEVSGTPEVSGRSASPSSEVSEKGVLGVIQMQIAVAEFFTAVLDHFNADDSYTSS